VQNVLRDDMFYGAIAWKDWVKSTILLSGSYFRQIFEAGVS
jgi:hypothetical protein